MPPEMPGRGNSLEKRLSEDPAASQRSRERHQPNRSTGAVFETKRAGLASFLFAMLHRRRAKAASVDSETVRLMFGARTVQMLSLGDVETVNVAVGLFWSGISFRHAAGISHVSGLPRTDARALAGAVETARCAWWHRTIAARAGMLRAIHSRIAKLADPPEYLTSDALQKLETDARAVVAGLAIWQPEAMSDIPESTVLKDIFQFLKSPDDTRANANKTFLANEMVRSRELFDQVEARPLTGEQRKAVAVDGNRNLVVAAAGSGKTSVIVAKAGWLVRRMNRKPSELLLLAFASDARREMEERIRRRLGTGISDGMTVCTFHSLGLRIISEAEGKRPALAATAENDRMLFNQLKEIIADLIVDSELSAELLEWFRDRSAPYRSPHECRNWSEYYDYIRKFDIRSLKGETVRSFEECEIANFLYLNGVAYEYESPYRHDLATSQRRQYKPDFHLPDHGIYIEHFGIDAKGNTAPFVDREQYLREMDWKRGIHAEYETTLIETFSHEQADGRLLSSLAEKLTSHGVILTPIPPRKMFALLEKQDRVDPFTRLAATFLQHFKGSGLSFADIAERAGGLRDQARSRSFLAVFRPIFERYQESLDRSGEIDFHDMIRRATELVESGRYRSAFGYILVDEFQDISPARARLLKALLDSGPDTRLFAVGDDWQAIYRFGGSDIAVMREFEDYFGAFERIDLAATFRCADRIARVSSDFVLRNPAQIRKSVRAVREASRPAIHVGLSGGQDLSPMKKALDLIAEDARLHGGTSDVLLLSRYRHLRPRNLPVLQKQYPGLRFTWMTVHRSKGLEADYAVVLGLCSGRYGFPAEVADDPLLNLVLAAPEAHSNAEERRLFYVALTRAKRQVFLLAEGGPPSEFVMELINGGYDIEIFGRTPEQDVSCPRCGGGWMKRQENARTGSVFYGCSNFPFCGHTARACPKCAKGLPIRCGNFHRCRDCGGEIESCPECGGWLDIRMGKYGRFLGCSNFPDCGYTRNLRPARKKPASAPDTARSRKGLP